MQMVCRNPSHLPLMVARAGVNQPAQICKHSKPSLTCASGNVASIVSAPLRYEGNKRGGFVCIAGMTST